MSKIMKIRLSHVTFYQGGEAVRVLSSPKVLQRPSLHRIVHLQKCPQIKFM